MKYHIGTKFKTRHKIPFIYTVIDFHTTTNSKGETVKWFLDNLYVAKRTPVKALIEQARKAG